LYIYLKYVHHVSLVSGYESSSVIKEFPPEGVMPSHKIGVNHGSTSGKKNEQVSVSISGRSLGIGELLF
jgi:hypothetical protein